MVIHTYEHEYPVSYVQELSDVSEYYICHNPVQGGFCRILVIADRALITRILPDIAIADSIPAFSDHIEHFMYDDALCIAMSYAQGITLKNKLETENLRFTEKLELGRRILERMILQEIPAYYLARCATPDTIIVDSDMTIHFNYPIEDIAHASTVTAEEARRQVAGLLRYIFAPEEERYISEDLNRFLSSLTTLTVESELIDIYQAYHEMMLHVIASEGKTSEESSFWHQLWEKIKRIFVSLKKVLMVALLVAAAVYLIYTIGDTKGSGTHHRNFERIGTVQIK